MKMIEITESSPEMKFIIEKMLLIPAEIVKEALNGRKTVILNSI